MVASELAPTAKAGGLGDVVSGLSRELEIRGNAVEIILPKYATRPREFRALAANCMRADYSWARPGLEYLEVYEDVRSK